MKKIATENFRIMKKTNTISTLLGFTQEDMAMLLGVSRGQWSMYESGKRDIPLQAKLLLAEMLQFMQTPSATISSKLPHVAHQEAKKKEQLERMLKENEYQQLLVAKKLAALEKKYTAAVSVLQLMDHLAMLSDHKKAFDQGLLHRVAAKSASTLTKSGLPSLIKLQIKQELLEQEKLVIARVLRKIA